MGGRRGRDREPLKAVVYIRQCTQKPVAECENRPSEKPQKPAYKRDLKKGHIKTGTVE